ncbi:MAG: cadherin domain-containing protein [Pseudomonadota bacterium]
MTKRISQVNTVVVPAAEAHAANGAAVAAKVVVPAEAEVAAVKADATAEVPATVVADPVVALVAPAPLAMVAEPVAAAAQTDAAASTSAQSDDNETDYTPYIVGGVLLAGGILAVALSSGDDNNSTPAPAPAPTNAVTFSSATTASVAENVAAGATGVVAIDVNAAAAATGGAITYTLGGADAALFTINATTGEVRFVNSPNFEVKPSYAITVTASSAANGTTPAATATQAITISITNVNEAPSFANATATATVAENAAITTPVFTAAATDPDANTTLTYTLGGTDAAAFTINATTGAVSLRAPADFETKSSYTFTVTATDNATPALSSTVQTVTLNVTNVNEAPTFTATTRTTTVAENVAAGTALFTAGGAVDPDAGATVTYTLTGADAAAFAVNATTGAVTFVASPNFEVKPSYSFNLVATDQAGLTTSQANTVTITNVNEAPTFAAATRVATLDENVAAGTVVPGSATATDPDAGATLTYSLTGTDAARFTINPTTGVVSIVASPDFETKASYSFNVVATDQGGLSSSQAVTLNINDLPEGVRIDGAGIAAGTNVNYDAAVGNVTYIESGAVGNVSTINNFTTGDIIQTDVATSNYSFSSVGTTLVISFNNNGVVSQISLPGAAGNNFIFNEATAEQAVGFDFFRTSAAAPPAATNTLAGTATLSAANAAVTYNESATSPNTTTITNFGSDDRIVVTGVSGTGAGQIYSFGSNGSDLTISFSDNGIPSQITLVGVANPNVFVFNEASAEQAVGFDFFRYG